MLDETNFPLAIFRRRQHAVSGSGANGRLPVAVDLLTLVGLIKTYNSKLLWRLCGAVVLAFVNPSLIGK